MSQSGSMPDDGARLSRALPLLLAVPTLLFFAPALFFGRVLYEHDTGLYFLPHKLLIARTLRAGRLPLWNPGEYGGVPLLADPNFNLFHPLSLLAQLLPMPLGFSAFVAACALLAALGAFALGRALGLSRGGACVVAAVFAWTGPYLSFLEGGQLASASFMPWLCAAAVLQARTPERRTFGAVAVASALVLLSGTPEVGACAFALAALLGSGCGAPRRGGRGLLAFAGACALGAALAAAQIAPSLAFLARSSRTEGFDFARATAYSLHPLRLAGLAIPFFTGDLDAPGTPWWLALPPAYVAEVYLGLLPLLLAAVGLRALPPRLRWPLLGAATVLLLAALGHHTPLYRLAWDALPPLRGVRFPEKLVVPFALCAAIFAGAGWTRLRARLEEHALPGRRTLWALAGAAAALAALAFFAAHAGAFWSARLGPARALCLQATALPSAALELCAVALALAALALAAGGALRPGAAALACGALLCLALAAPALELDATAPASALTEPSPLAAQLRERAGAEPWAFRVESHDGGLPPEIVDRAPFPELPRSRRVLAIWRLALADAGAILDGTQLAAGYSGFTGSRMRDFFSGPAPKAALDRFGVRFGVEFGATDGHYQQLGFRRVFTAARGLVRVYENEAAGERLRVADVVLLGRRRSAPASCPGRAAAWVSPEDAALLPPGLAAVPACPAAALPPAQPARAHMLSYAAERVEAEATLAAPGLLVLADALEPGWSATVDGAPAAPLAADGALRAVGLTAGAHRVVWSYRAPGLRAGCAVSLIALLALAALLAPRRRRVSPGE